MRVSLLGIIASLLLSTLCTIAQPQNSGAVTDTSKSKKAVEKVDTSKSTKTVEKLVQQVANHVTIYGYVRNEAYYDSRSNAYLRDGLLNIYPSDKSGGIGNLDANNIPQLGFSAIVTRLGFRLSNLTLLGSNLTGAIETDFFGVSNNPSVAGGVNGYFGTQSLLRLRHAFIKMEWSKVSVLVGQWWNPGFILECFPGVANFNTGMPFNPFAFNPQFRLTYKIAKPLSLMVLAYTYDIATFAPVVPPNGVIVSGVDAQRYSTIPSFATQLTFNKGPVLAGIGAEVGALRPHTNDSMNGGIYGRGGTGKQIVNIKTNLVTYNLLAYMKITTAPIVYKLYGAFGQSYTGSVGVGGFAQYRNATTGALTYVPQNQLNLWTELIVTKNEHFQPALFLGYAKNLGLASNITSRYPGSAISFYGRPTTASRTYDYLYRIAPRLDVLFHRARFTLEYEFSSMLYGNLSLTNMRVARVNPDHFTANNHRLLLLVIYNF